MKNNGLKCYTATFYKSYNYGATLQAYSLQKTLLGLGYDNLIINYNKGNDKNITPLKVRLARTMLKILSLFRGNSIAKLHKKFDDFNSEFLKLTPLLSNINEVNEFVKNAAFLLTGSDQVFSLREPDIVNSVNMLSLGDCAIPKFSYAASLAQYDLTDYEKGTFFDLLATFNKISVREDAAKNYIESFVNKNLLVHVDPIFLMPKHEWEFFSVKPSYKEKYILYFQVNSNPISNEVLSFLKRKYKLKIVCLQTNPNVKVKCDKKILSASPQEFVGWINNAEIVVTTSFHGAAFSLNLNKDFFVLTKPSSNPHRIHDLLKNFECESRLITNVDEINASPSICWNCVNEIAERKRKEALEYLESIGGMIKDDYQ